MAAPEKHTLDCRNCGKPLTFRRVADLPFFPFCSERCRLVDLGAWFGEDHRISTPLPPGSVPDDTSSLPSDE